MSIQDVCAAIQDKLLGLGVRSAPDYPPNQITLTPVAITYPASGTIGGLGSGYMKELHTVNIDLVMPAKDLTRDLTALNPYLRSIPNVIMKDPRFNSNASTFDSITYSFIVFEDGGIQYRGYRFAITGIKIEPAIT